MTRNRPLTWQSMAGLFLLWSLALLSTGRVSRATAAEELDSEMVPKLIKLMSYGHLKKPDLSTQIIKDIIQNFLLRLDPTRTAYLQNEADAKTQMTDEVLEELVTQIEDGNLSYFSGWISEFTTTQLARDQTFHDSLANKKDLIKAKYDKDDYKNIDFETFPKTLEEREKRYLLRAVYFYRLYKDYLSEDEAVTYALQTLAQIREKAKFDADTETPKVIMKAYMQALDPHSEYLDSQDIENFESSMARSFAGIGVQIRGCPLGAQVVEVIKGGPTLRSGQIEHGDQIIQVDGDVLAGESLSKIVQRIKGEKGTKVTLTIKKTPKKEGEEPKIKEVPLTRDTIDLAELRVTGKKFDTTSGPIGMVSVESFYQDVADDVVDRIKQLGNPEPLKGLVLDLRRNSGGLLKEAIRMVGLFITEGPVVAERDSAGRNHWNKDEDDSVAFDGPLIVLVNQFSASASEIVAGSLQDYQRAFIVGPSQTHGKGTVQRIVDLRRQGIPGQFKLTIRQYFLAGGASVQKRGVIPDIEIPGGKLLKEYLEGSDKGALEWDRIDSALEKSQPDFAKYSKIKVACLAHLMERSKTRVAANKDFDIFRKMALEDAKEEAEKVGKVGQDKTDPDKKEGDAKTEEQTAQVAEKKEEVKLPNQDVADAETQAEKDGDPDDPNAEKEDRKDAQAEEAVKIAQDLIDFLSKDKHAVATPDDKPIETK